MATLIYYENLDYDCLPTSKKRRSDSSTVLVPVNDPGDNTAPPSGSTYDNSVPHKPAGSSSYGPAASRRLNSNYKPANEATSIGANFMPANELSSYHSSASDATLPYDCTSPPYKSSHSSSSVTFQSYASSASATATSYSSSHNRGQSAKSRPPPPRRSNSNSNSYSSPPTSAASCHSSPVVVPSYEAPDDQLLHDTLKKYFKFNTFRENQLEAVNASCAGLDTLILMPTGGGKSICYQLPAILSPGITIVVSPLKSLIADQVNRMRALHVKTSALGGETKDDEAESIIWDLRQEVPEHKLLFVTPEKIGASGSLMSIFHQLHKRGLLARFVIDEAHCVSMWGADFRPDYRKLGKLRDEFPRVPIMALTATAPPKVRDDILDQLRMSKQNSRVFIQSFNRPNLKFEVRAKTKGCLKEISQMIHANFSRQCGIIYCLSRNDCELTASGLREQGITSAPYHAGLPDEQRKRVFNAWSRGTFQVVCATIAFGMGIDKSDVRFVIHYSMPKSVEGYYQEAGRAGRDGKFASCILYFSKSDLYRMKSMLSKTGFGRKVEDKTRDHGNLQHMIDYVDNKAECRRSILLRYLGEEFNSKDCISHIATACDNCLSKSKYGRHMD